MARESKFYRDTLEYLNKNVSKQDMFSFDEVKKIMGWSDTRTVKKYLGKYIVNERVCKTILAHYMCGDIKE